MPAHRGVPQRHEAAARSSSTRSCATSTRSSATPATTSTEIAAFFANDVAATQATDRPPGAPAPVHYLRTTNPLNPENLAAYPRGIATNRANPYVEPGGYSKLPTGLKVFGTYLCTNNAVPLLARSPRTCRSPRGRCSRSSCSAVPPAPPQRPPARSRGRSAAWWASRASTRTSAAAALAVDAPRGRSRSGRAARSGPGGQLCGIRDVRRGCAAAAAFVCACEHASSERLKVFGAR